jgi:hypothetical protein
MGSNETNIVLQDLNNGSQTQDPKCSDEPRSRPIEKVHYKMLRSLVFIRPLRNCASFSLGMMILF